MKVTVLGCGGSGGVPLINGNWGRCNPGNPKNRRRRVSVLVEDAGQIILIDTSPDLRLQLLDAGVRRIDAVLYTHDHADHCHGIDELRAFGHDRKGVPIPAYGTAETLDLLRQRFRYIFEQSADGSSALYRPLLEARPIDGDFSIGSLPVSPFAQDHGYGATTTGYRIGDVAYSTDVVGLDDAAFVALAGLDLWIVDCLRYEPHPTHAHLGMAIELGEKCRAGRVVLSHLDKSMDYQTLCREVPDFVTVGYDGLELVA